MLSDSNKELQDFLKTNYIQNVSQVAPALKHAISAEPKYAKWITDNNYHWDEKKKAYVGGFNKHFKEYIVALPNNMFVWGIGNVVKILKNPDKLRLWVTGRGDDFVQKFLELAGYEKPINLDDPSKGGDIDVGEPVNRIKSFADLDDKNILDDPKHGGDIDLGKPVNRVFVPNQTDMGGVEINKYKAMAKQRGGLPSNLMIDLGLKAKKDGDQKMLDFLKTVRPLKENLSPLAELVQAIVKTVVEEMEEVDEMTGTAAASPISTPMAFSKRKVKEGEEADAVTDMHADHEADHYEKHYGSSKPNTEKQKKTPGTPRKSKALVKGKPVQFNENDVDEGHLLDPSSWSPEEVEAMKFLAGALGTGFIVSIVGRLTADLRKKLVDSSKLLKAGQVSVEQLRAWIKKQLARPLEEMTTTGDVSGYNIPAAFAKKGGSNKGVEGSEALGFTLTPIGKKEMSRTADKLLSENEQPVRKQRCAKCKRLKPTDAHGYIEGWECYDCRKGGVKEVAKVKPDYGTQLRMAWASAKNKKDAEAMAYYETLGDTSASVPFEKFKGSWAYEQWKKKPEIQAHIAKIQDEFKRSWWK